MNKSSQVIESLVRLMFGTSDLRSQHLYRESLQVLVELAKAEQRAEINMDMDANVRPSSRATIH